MKVRLLLIAIAGLIFAQSTNLFSQEVDANPIEPGKDVFNIYIGPVVGYNRSLHTVDLESFADDPLCPFFTNGSSNGYYFGLSYEYHIGEIKNSRHSIIGRVLYNTLPASMSKEGDVYPSLVDINGEEVSVYSSTKHTVEVEYSMITGEVMYRFLVISGMGLGLTIGPTFDFPITKTFVQKYQLIEPPNFQFKRVEPTPEHPEYAEYRYEDFDRTIVVKDGDIEGAEAFRFGIKAGVQYEINLPKLVVVPAVYYNFALTNLTSERDWKVNAIQVGVDIRYVFSFTK